MVTMADGCCTRAVPGFPGYYASTDGRILSERRRGVTELHPIVHKPDGHLYVFLYRQGLRRGVKCYVHQVVLRAFVGEPPPGEQCRHLDGNPRNNVLFNLAWGTRVEDTDDKRRQGRLPSGERSGTHRLTVNQVIEIRRLRGTATLREMGRRYGVSHTTLRRAALGIKWASVREGGNG